MFGASAGWWRAVRRGIAARPCTSRRQHSSCIRRPAGCCFDGMSDSRRGCRSVAMAIPASGIHSPLSCARVGRRLVWRTSSRGRTRRCGTSSWCPCRRTTANRRTSTPTYGSCWRRSVRMQPGPNVQRRCCDGSRSTMPSISPLRRTSARRSDGPAASSPPTTEQHVGRAFAGRPTSRPWNRFVSGRVVCDAATCQLLER